MIIITHLKPDGIPVCTISCNVKKFCSLPAEYIFVILFLETSHYLLTQDQPYSIYDRYGLCSLWRRNLISTVKGQYVLLRSGYPSGILYVIKIVSVLKFFKIPFKNQFHTTHRQFPTSLQRQAVNAAYRKHNNILGRKTQILLTKISWHIL
jgi:hypothetical protein